MKRSFLKRMVTSAEMDVNKVSRICFNRPSMKSLEPLAMIFKSSREEASPSMLLWFLYVI